MKLNEFKKASYSHIFSLHLVLVLWLLVALLGCRKKEIPVEINKDRSVKIIEEKKDNSPDSESTEAGTELSEVIIGRWFLYKIDEELFVGNRSGAFDGAPMIPYSDGINGVGYDFNKGGSFGEGKYNSGMYSMGQWSQNGNILTLEIPPMDVPGSDSFERDDSTIVIYLEVFVEDSYHIRIKEGNEIKFFAKNDMELMKIIDNDNFAAFVEYFKDGKKINSHFADNLSPLSLLIAQGKPKFAKHLIDLGADVNNPNAFSMTALHYASKSWLVGEEWDHLLESLLDHGADPNAKDNWGQTPLDYTLCQDRRYSSFVRAKRDILRSYGAKNGNSKWATFLVDQDGITGTGEELYKAAEEGNAIDVQRLIAERVDVNFKTETSWSPLLVASYGGYTEIVKQLLKAGADVNILTNDFVNPLIAAVNSGSYPTVKVLIEAGADVEVVDAMGNTALGSAESLAYIEIAELLKSEGALPDSSAEFSK